MLSLRHLVALAMLLALPGVAWTETRVTVSSAPLHSLVTNLMAGAGTSTLWMNPDQAPDATASPAQVRELIAADLIVWSGPGLELSLAWAIDQQVPAAKANLVTLSDHLPLLPKASERAAASLDRQTSRALSFWMDPRLAMAAVHHLTPILVRLDPEHQELYLENEMRLMHQLHQVEAEVAQILAPGISPAAALAEIDPYFRHRFLSEVPGSRALGQVASDCGTSAFRRVGHAGPVAAAGPLVPGAGYYSELLRREATRIAVPSGQGAAAQTGTAETSCGGLKSS